MYPRLASRGQYLPTIEVSNVTAIPPGASILVFKATQKGRDCTPQSTWFSMVQTDSSFSDNTSTHLTGAPVLTERECDDVAALVAQFTNVHLSKSSVTNLARSFLDYFANQTASPSDIPDEAVVTPPSITAALIDRQITEPGNVTVEHEVTLPSPPVVAVLSDVTESKETGLVGHGDTAMLTAEPAPAPVPGVAVLSGPVLPSVLVPPPDAPGSTSTWYRLYRGYSYCVPAPDSPAPFYCVTKGLRVGIFSGWENVGTLTLKVSGSIQRKVTSVEKGVHIFEQCLEDGKVEILFN